MLATLDSELILDIIGNSTRRKILSTLSQEPMYFNQLSKEIGVGQQSVLRHMQFLQDSGMISSYAEKSDLGAPDRKYYKLNSAFSLTVAISEDTFAIKNQSIVESRYTESKKFYKEFDSTPDDAGEALIHLQTNLKHIEDEILNLESHVNDLRALKQLIIKELHEIGREILTGHLERQVLYKIIEERGERIEGKRERRVNRKSIYDLSKTLDQNESRIKDAVAKINSKLEKASAEILLKDLR
ncbi:MAG TPA: ArsR family transcriptional regulator [Nitrososphaeraceae archaeon]|nr:ArsR family transcriptional regulator [Nitrososphaeraceae archaeon]